MDLEPLEINPWVRSSIRFSITCGRMPYTPEWK